MRKTSTACTLTDSTAPPQFLLLRATYIIIYDWEFSIHELETWKLIRDRMGLMVTLYQHLVTCRRYD
jgi:hypothetical protein